MSNFKENLYEKKSFIYQIGEAYYAIGTNTFARVTDTISSYSSTKKFPKQYPVVYAFHQLSCAKSKGCVGSSNIIDTFPSIRQTEKPVSANFEKLIYPLNGKIFERLEEVYE